MRKLGTKLPALFVKEYEDIEKYLELQLKKLQTDYIDYYLIHGVSKSSFDNLKEMGALEFLEEEAKRRAR